MNVAKKVAWIVAGTLVTLFALRMAPEAVRAKFRV